MSNFGEVMRTPDERFQSLPDFPYEPHYFENLTGYEGLRMAYIDEGPKDAERVYLCLHGEPSWSFLYRFMIPEFLATGARVIAPDLYGFGRSDKPKDDAVYTYHFHRNALLAFMEAIDIRNITLVCQDWGGILGLTLPMEMPEHFTRLIVMNTGLPAGQTPSKGFEAWRDFVASNPKFNVRDLMMRSTPKMTEAEGDAYGAPYPDPDYMAGARRFPALVMTDPAMDGVDISKRALKFWSTEWTGESFMAIGMQDPVLGPAVMHQFRKAIKNCPEPLEIEDAGHFVQEHGDIVAKAALKHFGETA